MKGETFMEKIYGYREKDVIGLAEFLKNKGNMNLTEVFYSYGKKSGKAKGTVRNLYYALAKKTNTDADFCQKYFDGKPLSVSKIVEFNGEEEKELIKKILVMKNEGYSVRSAIMELSDGDAKMALRYQNKFRNAMKCKPHLIAEIIAELKNEGKNVCFDGEKSVEEVVSESQLKRLKTEINGLVGKIAESVRRENEYLKDRIIRLERENLKLYNLLYGQEKPDKAYEFFKSREKRNALN